MALTSRRPVRRRVRRIRKARRPVVRREELNELVDFLNERAEVLNLLLQNQQIQFQRIAQIQAELDVIKRAWARVKLDDR